MLIEGCGKRILGRLVIAQMMIAVAMAAAPEEAPDFGQFHTPNSLTPEADELGFYSSSLSSSMAGNAIFILGNSSVDCGENTLLYSFLHRNYLLVPSFYSLNGSIQTLINGVNFGSAQATIPSFQFLNQQLGQVFETIQHLSLHLSSAIATHQIQSSIFYLSFGKEVFIRFFLHEYNSTLPSSLRHQSCVFLRIWADQMARSIWYLYDGDARKILVMHILPLGCAPRYVVRWYSMPGKRNDTRGCVNLINWLVVEYNKVIEEHVLDLKLELPDADAVYCDVYEGIMESIAKPRVYAAKMGLSTIPSFYSLNGSIQSLMNGVNFWSAQVIILFDPPNPLTWKRDDTRGCVEWINQLVLEYNKVIVLKLKLDLPDARVVYCDVYEWIIGIIAKRRVYGFPNERSGCCGRGWHHASSGCTSTDMVCDKPPSRVWWNLCNPTEAFNSLLADSAWSGKPFAHMCYPMTVQDLMSHSKSPDSGHYQMLMLQALEADELGFHSSSLSSSMVAPQEPPDSALTPYLTGPSQQIFNKFIIQQPTHSLDTSTRPIVSIVSFSKKMDVDPIRVCIHDYNTTLPESLKNQSPVFLSIVSNQGMISTWYIGDARNTWVMGILSSLQLEWSNQSTNGIQMDYKWNTFGIIGLGIVVLLAMGTFILYRKWTTNVEPKGEPELNEPLQQEPELNEPLQQEPLEEPSVDIEPKCTSKITYDKTKILGHGSFGTEVFMGSYAGRPAAIKRMLLTRCCLAEKEADYLRKVDSHPNIVRLYEHTSDKDFVYLALELCLGNLAELITNHSQKHNSEKFGDWLCLNSAEYPSVQLIDLIREIVTGIAYLHYNQIVHRDLKPENVLIIKDLNDIMHAKISDLDFSKELKNGSTFLITRSGDISTKIWSAPELSRGEQHNQSADIFSLGCIIFFSLSNGLHPFKKHLKNIQKDKKSIGLLKHSCYEGYCLVSDLLEHDPRNRPDICKVLAHPLFWDAEKHLSFFRDSSEALQANENLQNQFNLLRYRVFNDATWENLVTSALVRATRVYEYKDLSDLVRLFRNKINHHMDNDCDLQPYPEGLHRYFRKCVPKLSMILYEFMCRECRREGWMNRYM